MDAAAFARHVAPLLAQLLASANVHDVDRHCAIYARDAALTFIVNGEVLRGWDAYHARQREWWSDGRATGGYRYRGEHTYEALGEDAGMTTAIIVARVTLPDGQVREREIVFSALWRLRPEGWCITYAHESSR